MSSACTPPCSCREFHPHLFLQHKCLSCPHPLAMHGLGNTAAAAASTLPASAAAAAADGSGGEDADTVSELASSSATTPSYSAVRSPDASPPALPLPSDSGNRPAPRKPPPPVPGVASTVTLGSGSFPPPPPSNLGRKGSLPPPVPAALLKQYANSTDLGPSPPPLPATVPAAAGSPAASAAAASAAALAALPRPAPRASFSVPIRSPVPPPALSSSGLESPQFATAASPSPHSHFPPPPPPHLRTDSSSTNGEPPTFSPSPTTAASLSALLSSPLNPDTALPLRRGSIVAPPPPRLNVSTSSASAAPASLSASGLSSPSNKDQWVDPNYRPSFALKLHHKFDVVVDQSNAGMYLLKRVRAFMQRFSSLQERYAQELSKITSLERNKLIAAPKADGMPSCYASWLGFFSSMDSLAHANASFSQDLKEITVEQLEKFYSIGTNMVKDSKAEQERVSNSMLKVNVAVAKERDAATQALQKLANKRGDASGAESGSTPLAASSSTASGATKNPLAFLKGASNPQRSFDKHKESSIRACESYTQAISQGNIQHHRYHSEELPAMLTNMQSLEEMRLHSLMSALKDFSRLQADFTRRMLRVTEDVESAASALDANADIASFVSRVCEEHGPALAPIPFTYDIPISLAELKAMQMDEPPSSLFYSTLEGVMKHQKSMEGVLGSTANAVAQSVSSLGLGGGGGGRSLQLELPLIVPTLLRNIFECDGMRSEGIFRISVGSDELTRLRRQLEAGDFSLLNQSNPHTSACLLKSWFRDLLVPIVPFALYDRCIALGQMEPFTPALDPAHQSSMRAVLHDLPALNANILALLFGFLKRLAGTVEYVSKTRMNLANLSLVFSPGLVRSEQNDPLKMLQDTKYASNFVLRAVECTPACFSSEAQRVSTQILDEIFSGNVISPAQLHG